MPVLSTYIAAFVAMALVFVLTGAALHFAQYKKRGGCCSEGLRGTGYTTDHGCGSCKCEEGASAADALQSPRERSRS